MSFEWSTLEEVAEVIDSLHKTPTYSEFGLPMVRATDVKYGELNLTQTFNVDENTYSEFSRRYKPAIDDIIITRVGSYGITARVTKTKFCLGQNTSAIVPKKINARYLYSALNSSLIWSQIESGVVGSTQKTLSLKVIKAIKIPRLGENNEQEIATTLGALDDRITLLRETNATLEAIAQALFKSWFVDFDPVHAKAQGTKPEGMDEQTAALFPDSFEESELGMVPAGWEVKTLSELCKITSGKRPNNRSDIATPTLKTPLFGGAGLMGFTNESLFDEPKIITGRVGTLGKNFIAHPPFWASDNALILSPLKNRDFYFCFHWLNGVDVHGLNRGAVQPLLTQKDLGSQQKAIPCNELTKAFSNMAKSIYCKIHHQSEQIKTLTNLRDTLLPRLISGQLRLPDVEEMVG